MKMRLPVTFIIALLVLACPAQALMDNLYFTIPPDSSRCFNVRLPLDLNTLMRGYYTLETVSDFPVNLKYIKTFAEAVNIVKVPICFYSEGIREGNFSYYTIRAQSEDLYREFRGGICVSGTDDVESRQPQEGQNPCELINGYEDLFYISFLEPIQWALPGARINYTLLVQGMNQLDLDITFDSRLQVSPKKVSVHIPKTGRAKPVSLEVNAPNFGQYEIRAKARVRIGDRYCDMPFCEAETNTTLVVGSLVRSGFGLFIFPQFLSVDFAGPVPYTIFIENMDPDNSFDLDIGLPEGLEADWTQKTVTVRKDERMELQVNITPAGQEPASYTIGFTARSAGMEQSQYAYLSVKEIESDVLRRWNMTRENVSEIKRQELDFEIDRFIADYRKRGLDFEDYEKIDKLLKDAEQWTGPSPNGQEPAPGALDPLLIAIPIIAIIAALVFIFYKKARPFEGEREEW